MNSISLGVISGILEVCVTQPIDSYKVSRQVGTPYRPFAGMVPRLVGILPMRGVFWGTMWGVDVENPAIRGGLAGLAQTVVDTPIDVLKIRRQTSTIKPIYTGILPHACKNVIFASCVGMSLPHAPLGAFVGTTITHPLDVYKTSVQSGLPRTGWWSGWGPRTLQAMMAMACGQAVMWVNKILTDSDI